MPVQEEVERAVAALDLVRAQVKDPDGPGADPQLTAQLTKISALLEDPLLCRLLKIQDSLHRLRGQLVAHPSLVPADFDIVPETGELVVHLSPLGRPAAPAPTPATVVSAGGAEDDAAATNGAAPAELEDEVAVKYEVEKDSDLERSFPANGEAREDNTSEKEYGDDQHVQQPDQLDDSVELEDPDLAMLSQQPIMTGAYERELERAIAEVARGRQVVNIELCKEDGASLGFSVAGLACEQNQELGIFVQGIQPAGTAHLDGRLREGDQILAIDGQPLDANVSHPQAISILQQARGLVSLVVARSAEEAESSEPGGLVEPPTDAKPAAASQDMVLNTEWAQVEVIDLVNDGTGLGFGIIGGRSTGVVVKTILPGGVADRDGRLLSGDHILQIGEHNLRGMESVQVAQVLRTAGTEVRLIVARPVETSSPEFQSANALLGGAAILPTRLLADPEELEHQLQMLQAGYPEPYARDRLSEERNNLLNGQLPPEYDSRLMYDAQLGSPYRSHSPFDGQLTPSAYQPQLTSAYGEQLSTRFGVSAGFSDQLTSSFAGQLQEELETSSAEQPQPQLLPDTETCEVELTKDAAGLGVTIAGYVCEREELSGIFIKSVNPGSAADLSGRVAINDQIIEVDGCPLQGYTNHEAVELLKNTGQTVRLKLARYVSGPKYDQLRQAIARTETPAAGGGAPTTPPLPAQQPTRSPPLRLAEADALLESSSTDPDLVEALTGGSPGGAQSEFFGPLPADVEQTIQHRWGALLGPGYDIVVAQLSKFSPGGGLGVSLEGTVDVEDGREVRPHHYIRSILSDGPVGLNGRLRSGDELLEVNGRPLLQLNHMEVVTVLKELPADVRLVCARSWEPQLPSQPVDDDIMPISRLGEPLFSDRLLKAKSDSSLASSAASATDGSLSRLRSRSMEPLSGLAMWAAEPQTVVLEKGERGLGFSILDYQDPMNPSETVIVIRSLVPGGAAQLDGRLIPGDRLMSVNAVRLENASLDEAVQALKGAAAGPVRLGVAKPLPLTSDTSSSQVRAGAAAELAHHVLKAESF